MNPETENGSDARLAFEPLVRRFCYECRHWPGANTGHPNRVEMCKCGGGNTHGFACCDKWQHVLEKLSQQAYEDNLFQHGIIRW